VRRWPPAAERQLVIERAWFGRELRLGRAVVVTTLAAPAAEQRTAPLDSLSTNLKVRKRPFADPALVERVLFAELADVVTPATADKRLSLFAAQERARTDVADVVLVRGPDAPRVIHAWPAAIERDKDRA
jgi:hypothetical protein